MPALANWQCAIGWRSTSTFHRRAHHSRRHWQAASSIVLRYAWFPPFRCRSAVGGQPISVLVTSSLCIRKDVSSISVLTCNGLNGNGSTATEWWKLDITLLHRDSRGVGNCINDKRYNKTTTNCNSNQKQYCKIFMSE